MYTDNLKKSNGYTLSKTPERIGWLSPSDPPEPLETLRQRYRQEGYLWLKNFLNKQVVLDFRRRFHCRSPSGLLAPGSDPKRLSFLAKRTSRLLDPDGILAPPPGELLFVRAEIWQFL